MSGRSPQFFYFDLGNVLLTFDHRLAARQMAEVAGIAPESAWETVFAGDLHRRFERGDISSREYYDLFCQRSGTRPDCEALFRAGADIFELNVSVVPIVGQLRAAGCRLGILSNTNPVHWQFVSDGHFSLIKHYFQVHALSYQIRAMKPEPKIYAAAIQLAGVAPEQIFFVDDREDNVAGAREAGFDAVLYESAQQLAADLRKRGVRFNY